MWYSWFCDSWCNGSTMASGIIGVLSLGSIVANILKATTKDSE